MPSPIAHSVSGYVLNKALKVKNPFFKRQTYSKLISFYAVFVAIFADFDFIPQLLTGIRFHRGITHTIIFAVVFSIISTWVVSRWQKQSYLKLFALTLFIYTSHLFLDYFTAGGKGLQLFFPLSDVYFQSPIILFPGVHHSQGIFALSHLVFIGWEACYSLLLIALLWLWQNNTHNIFSKRQRR